MNTIFVLLMFIPYDRGPTSIVAEFNDENACYSAALTFKEKFGESWKNRMPFVCMPKGSKK